MLDLNQLRQSIDAIDDQLLALLNERMDIIKQVGELKKKEKSIIYRPERERYILDRLAQKSANRLLTRAALEAIFLEIFAVSRNFELPERVAYLGPEGSFTHQAAESRFGQMSEYVSLPNISAVFENIATERTRFGVVPIENNLEGFVEDTLEMLQEMPVSIVAEILLPIHHTFVSRHDNLKQIRYVYSKDIVFKQCRKFLHDYFQQQSIELIPVDSTSKAAQMAMENEHSAAICSIVAAKLYQAPIVFENIEDNTHNQTRILILSKNFENQPSEKDKISLVLYPDGSANTILPQLMEALMQHQIQLYKIDSRPWRKNPHFQNWWYLEVAGHYQDTALAQCLQQFATSLRCLGSYTHSLT
ncbi:MAG TPA: chorismate mutase [Microscillaceae bacterium]|nr:chorismate mutase [Microscillaceae bacterium]